MTEYNLFCADKEYDGKDSFQQERDSFQQERYRAFNQVVGEKRYNEILSLIKGDILRGLKLELNENNWQIEWKKVKVEQWQRMQNEIPEFDLEVVEMVIGFNPLPQV